MLVPLASQRFLVLVVAADRVFAERCRRDLEAYGHRASVAPGWWIGVHLAEVDRPDLVVVDESLADVDGLTVLALLKAHPGTARIPVVVAAAREQCELRLRAQRLGARATALKSELTVERLVGYATGSSRVGPAS